jgi:ribose 5-phosphate isomerase B
MPRMKIYFAADHGGFETKVNLVAFVRGELGHDVEDCGAYIYDAEDDYPDLIIPCARKVAADSGSFGIIGGGSGNGEAIAANRVSGARAAVFHGRTRAVSNIDVSGAKGSEDGFDIVRLARKHNNANMLSFGFRFVSEEDAREAIRIFLATPFEGGRHERRVNKLDA